MGGYDNQYVGESVGYNPHYDHYRYRMSKANHGLPDYNTYDYRYTVSNDSKLNI